MLVSLHDVHSEYRGLKGGNHALVIAGTARNVGKHPLHLVQIDADLLDGAGDAERTAAHQTVYAGNELSAEMLGQMTPREIEFSQSLSPQKSFAIPPTAGVPFLMVFINPPEPVGALRLSVTKAIAVEPPISAAAKAVFLPARHTEVPLSRGSFPITAALELDLKPAWDARCLWCDRIFTPRATGGSV